MPRRRPAKSSEFPTAQPEPPQLQSVEPEPRSVQDPDKFFRAVAELERVRGSRVHPGSPTVH